MSIEVTEKAHAVLGPSGWHTWGTCPGSVPLSEGLPNVSSKYAKEGTAAHQVLEDSLKQGVDAETFLGEEIIVEGEVFYVNNEMADAVNSSIDVIRTYIKAERGDVLMVEQSVPLAFMTGEEGAEGTCDVSGITENGTHLVIADFKYGQGVQVYASDRVLMGEGQVTETQREEIYDYRPNGQLAMYALGWLEKHGFLYEDVEKVTLVVLQPRKEWVDDITLPISELRNFADRVRDAAGAVELNRQVAAEGNDLDLVPSEKGCKFCTAKAICPALRNTVSTALAVVSEASDFADLTLPKQAASVAIDRSVSNEKLAEFMRAIPLIEQAIKGVQAEVETRLFAGQEIPGLYLGVGRAGRRAWANEEQALKELTKSGRLKMTEAIARKPISPTQAEKLLKEKPKVWAKIAPLITQSEGGPSVCKDGDKNKRFEIASTTEEFQNLDAQPSLESMLD